MEIKKLLHWNFMLQINGHQKSDGDGLGKRYTIGLNKSAD